MNSVAPLYELLNLFRVLVPSQWLRQNYSRTLDSCWQFWVEHKSVICRGFRFPSKIWKMSVIRWRFLELQDWADSWLQPTFRLSRTTPPPFPKLRAVWNKPIFFFFCFFCNLNCQPSWVHCRIVCPATNGGEGGVQTDGRLRLLTPGIACRATLYIFYLFNEVYICNVTWRFILHDIASLILQLVTFACDLSPDRLMPKSFEKTWVAWFFFAHLFSFHVQIAGSWFLEGWMPVVIRSDC